MLHGHRPCRGSCSGVWLAGDTGPHEVACSRMKSPTRFRSNSTSTGEIDQQGENDQGKTVEEADLKEGWESGEAEESDTLRQAGDQRPRGMKCFRNVLGK